jgi:hypothetical protein
MDQQKLDTPIPTYSVTFRLQRTTTESAFVSVPVTSDLIVVMNDGKGRLAVEKMLLRAAKLGADVNLDWQFERRVVEPHPVQSLPPMLEQE